MNLRNAFTYLVFLFFAYSTPLVAAESLEEKKVHAAAARVFTLYSDGTAYSNQGKYSQALAQFELALKIHEKELSYKKIACGFVIQNTGLLYLQKEYYRLVVARIEASIELKEKKLNAKDLGYNKIPNGSQANYSLALAQLKSALNLRKRERNISHPYYSNMLQDVGKIYQSQNGYDLALKAYKLALAKYHAERENQHQRR